MNGSAMQTHYRYTGQEHGPAGLPYYDYIARQYDPALGRFLGVDPLVDARPWESPYSYTGNNPINRIDPTGLIWEDINGNRIEDHSNIRVYIFYDTDFKRQSLSMYREFEKKYGKGSVALSNVMTMEEFVQDWKDMASSNIVEVNLNYHGGPQTVNLDWRTDQYLTATGDGKTPGGRNAVNISELPLPSGNIWEAQLNINTCRSNDVCAVPEGSSTIAQSFRDNSYFRSVRTTPKNISYHYWFSPDRPRPQDHSAWQILYRHIPQNFPGAGLSPR